MDQPFIHYYIEICWPSKVFFVDNKNEHTFKNHKRVNQTTVDAILYHHVFIYLNKGIFPTLIILHFWFSKLIMLHSRHFTVAIKKENSLNQPIFFVEMAGLDKIQ